MMSVLAWIGAFCAARFGYKIILRIYSFLSPSVSLDHYGAKKGGWAVITGASDGIGRQFAIQLAKAGFNVFLIARSEDKLKNVAMEVEKFNVQAKVHVFDFSNALDTDLLSSLSALEIRVLVNNAATNHSGSMNFDLESKRVIRDIIRVNVESPLLLTHEVLQMMNKQVPCLILNIGSFAGMCPQPMLSVYGGSKSFLQSWSMALSQELVETKVRVEYICAYFVVTSMSGVKRPSFYIPTPTNFVESCLKMLGKSNFVTPYFSHAIMHFVMDLCPESYLIQKLHNDRIRRKRIKGL